MRRSLLLLVLAGTAALSGCSKLISLNPFVTDEHTVMDNALLGTWVGEDGKDTYLVKQDGTGYRIHYVSDSSEPYDFKARLMVTDDVRILDIVSARDDDFQLAVHTPVRAWLDGDTLRFAFLDSDWSVEQARQQIQTAETEKAQKDKRTLITASGEAARVFFTKIGADPKACGDQNVLHRLR